MDYELWNIPARTDPKCVCVRESLGVRVSSMCVRVPVCV